VKILGRRRRAEHAAVPRGAPRPGRYEVLTASGVPQAREVLGTGQVDLVVSDMRSGRRAASRC
jgi:hypothetical protein